MSQILKIQPPAPPPKLWSCPPPSEFYPSPLKMSEECMKFFAVRAKWWIFIDFLGRDWIHLSPCSPSGGGAKFLEADEAKKNCTCILGKWGTPWTNPWGCCTQCLSWPLKWMYECTYNLKIGILLEKVAYEYVIFISFYDCNNQKGPRRCLFF